MTKEEVIYLSDNRYENGRILCINPAESLEPVVVAQLQTEGRSVLTDLFVTDGGTIYVAVVCRRLGKVLAFHPGSANLTKVLQCPDGLAPPALWVQDTQLYVSMLELPPVNGVSGRGVSAYLLPPEVQLQ